MDPTRPPGRPPGRQAGVRRAAGWAGAVPVRLPVTTAYLGLLGLVTLALEAGPAPVRAHLVLAASTNLANLGQGRWATLLTSAFVAGPRVPGPGWWLALAGLLASAELLWGSWRAVLTFLAGHVGATLLVAAGLAAGMTAGWLPAAWATAPDVGASYGLLAVLGALAAGAPPAVRRGAVPLLVAAVGVGLLLRPTFTAAGHLVALLIGLLIGTAAGAWRPGVPGQSPAGSQEIVRLG